MRAPAPLSPKRPSPTHRNRALIFASELEFSALLDSYLFIRKQEYFNKFKQLGAVG
jgi:hypothetical protein